MHINRENKLNDRITFKEEKGKISADKIFRRTKVPKIWLAAENFVRRKFLSAENFISRNILLAKIKNIPCTIKSY